MGIHRDNQRDLQRSVLKSRVSSALDHSLARPLAHSTLTFDSDRSLAGGQLIIGQRNRGRFLGQTGRGRRAGSLRPPYTSAAPAAVAGWVSPAVLAPSPRRTAGALSPPIKGDEGGGGRQPQATASQQHDYRHLDPAAEAAGLGRVRLDAGDRRGQRPSARLPGVHRLRRHLSRRAIPIPVRRCHQRLRRRPSPAARLTLSARQVRDQDRGPRPGLGPGRPALVSTVRHDQQLRAVLQGHAVAGEPVLELCVHLTARSLMTSSRFCRLFFALTEATTVVPTHSHSSPLNRSRGSSAHLFM